MAAAPHYPKELRYTKEHEWVKSAQDGSALVGITFFAQEQLGDIVYLDLPKAGTQLRQFAKLGEVESVKAVSDLFSPLGGEVLDVNQETIDHPELVNQDPYGKGWLLRVRPQDPEGLKGLLTAAEYEALLAQGQKQ